MAVCPYWHKKLKRWLPPGGVIESHERPDEAALREVKEEVGLDVKLIGFQAPSLPDVELIHAPIHIQIEHNPHGDDNIDFIYYAEPCSSDQTILLNEQEITKCLWFTHEDVLSEIPEKEVQANALRALSYKF